MKYSLVLLAAGSGSRMNLGYNKMFLKINEIPLVLLTAKHFFNDDNCSEIIYVVNENEVNEIKDLLKQNNMYDDRCQLVVGGSERQHSVYNGLEKVTQDIVLIHDAARPFINKKLIKNLTIEAKQHGCAIPVVKVKDTIKVIQDGFVEQTLNRDLLYAVQTPQACRTDYIKDAHQLSKQEQYLGTDEASLIEKYNITSVKAINGSYDNIKVTTKEDIQLAQSLYKTYFL